MKVGDLVQFTSSVGDSDQKKVGLVFMIDETIDHADPDVKWCGVRWNDSRLSPLGYTVTASRYLEVISESR